MSPESTIKRMHEIFTRYCNSNENTRIIGLYPPEIQSKVLKSTTIKYPILLTYDGANSWCVIGLHAIEWRYNNIQRSELWLNVRLCGPRTFIEKTLTDAVLENEDEFVIMDNNGNTHVVASGNQPEIQGLWNVCRSLILSHRKK